MLQTATRKPSYYHPHRIGECVIEHGIGGVERLPEILDYLGKKRAYVLCGPNAAKGQTINRITDVLGPLQVGLYDECRHQAPVSSVYKLAELVTAADADVLIPLGGGSTSDTAKGVACTLGEGRPLEELASRYTPPAVYRENYMKAPKMPIVSIASMFGGAEMAPGFGNKTAEGHKIAFRGDYVTARVVILDPTVTMDVDLQTLCESTFNGLAHGIEGTYSLSRTPIAEALCWESIRLFADNMPRLIARPGDLDVRLQLQWAGAMGGMIVTNARVGFQHGCAHSIGAAVNISHGVCNALTLPGGIEFNLDVATEQLAGVARAMGVASPDGNDHTSARNVISRIRALQRELGLPERLTDIPSVKPRAAEKEQILDRIADLSQRNRSHLFNPRPFGPEDVRALVNSIW
jgi:alcohol dehydrogenase class IV